MATVELLDSWSPTVEVTPQLPSLGDMPYKVDIPAQPRAIQGHVVNAFATALEHKKAIVVNPKVISHVVEPASIGMIASTQGFELPPIIVHRLLHQSINKIYIILFITYIFL